MVKLKLLKDWAGPKGIMHAGEYDIPRQISLTHAKAARFDMAGEIVETEAAASATFPGGASANFLPETKENPRERAPAPAGGRQPGKRGKGSPAS